MIESLSSGNGLTFQHFRMNDECGVLEELEPIEQNLNYDFNFQQYNHLAKERLILPVSILIDDYTQFLSTNFHFQGDVLSLKCFYNTSGRSDLTLVRLG